MDGYHKLIRWRFVIHGCIDGYSRLIVFLECSNSNKADIVLDKFLGAIEKYRTPLRIRTDHGTENVLVARYMLERHGIAKNPVITGKSVHNQRIERLWVDVFIYVAQYFRNLFYYLESEYGLDPNDEEHLFALHFVYMPRINKMLEEFLSSWNNHGLRTEKNQSPNQLWTQGFYRLSSSTQDDLLDLTENVALYGVDADGPTPELQTNNDVQVPEINIELSREEEGYITNNFVPLRNDENHGIEVFTSLLEYLRNRFV